MVDSNDSGLTTDETIAWRLRPCAARSWRRFRFAAVSQIMESGRRRPSPPITARLIEPFQGRIMSRTWTRNQEPPMTREFSLAFSMTERCPGRVASPLMIRLTTILRGNRPQFQPEVAVDQSTGTSSCRARCRAMTQRERASRRTSEPASMAAKPSGLILTPTCRIRRSMPSPRHDHLEPIPDNQSAGNPNTETVLALARDKPGGGRWTGDPGLVWQSKRWGRRQSSAANLSRRCLLRPVPGSSPARPAR